MRLSFWKYSVNVRNDYWLLKKFNNFALVKGNKFHCRTAYLCVYKYVINA